MFSRVLLLEPLLGSGLARDTERKSLFCVRYSIAAVQRPLHHLPPVNTIQTGLDQVPAGSKGLHRKAQEISARCEPYHMHLTDFNKGHVHPMPTGKNDAIKG